MSHFLLQVHRHALVMHNMVLVAIELYDPIVTKMLNTLGFVAEVHHTYGAFLRLSVQTFYALGIK